MVIGLVRWMRGRHAPRSARRSNGLAILFAVGLHVSLIWLLAHPARRHPDQVSQRPTIQWLVLPQPSRALTEPGDSIADLSLPSKPRPPRLQRSPAAEAQAAARLPSPTRVREPASLPITALPVAPPLPPITPQISVPAPTPSDSDEPAQRAGEPGLPDPLHGSATRRAIEEAAHALERESQHPRGPGIAPAPPPTLEQKIGRALYRTPAYTEFRASDGTTLIKMPDGTCMVNPSDAEIRDQGAKLVRFTTPELDARCPK